MKALATGATGFIGSSRVRKNGKTKNIDGLNLEKANGDIRDKESVKAR